MSEPARAYVPVSEWDDGPLSPAEEAALAARVDAALAEGGEPVPAEVLFAELGLDDE